MAPGAVEPEEEEQGPERRCIASGASRPKEELIRFAVSPDGEVVPDLEGRLPGRGFWVGGERATLQRAVDGKSFPRAARRQVTVPPDLADRVGAMLRRRCLQTLALARKSGEAVAGMEKVCDFLRAQPAGLVLAARGAGADGLARVERLAGSAPRLDLFSADELGQVFGREAATHVVVARGGLARRLVAEAARLAAFEGQGACV